MQLMTLNELLSCVETLDWTHELYLPMNETWTEITSCAVLESEEDEMSNETSDYVSQNNFKYILGIQSIQDIVSNAKTQKSNASTKDLFQAFLHYYRNDSFIAF